jgi:putative transposase
MFTRCGNGLRTWRIGRFRDGFLMRFAALCISYGLPLLAYQSRCEYNSNMTDYRRNRVPGGTFFFTVNLYDRQSRLLAQHIDALRNAVRQIQRRAPFHIDAWVVLPEHMHALWTLPEDDTDYARRWNAIKTDFSRNLPPGEYRSASRKIRRERGIWQRRFWEHTIRDDQDYANHMDYIHFNPVRHRLVEQVADWPFSSFHRAVAKGQYAREWAVNVELEDAGEP